MRKNIIRYIKFRKDYFKMENLSLFQKVSTVICSVLTFLLGDFILPLKVLLALLTLDYLTGIMKALYLGNLKSREA